jgi:hypothetical protein
VSSLSVKKRKPFISLMVFLGATVIGVRYRLATVYAAANMQVLEAVPLIDKHSQTQQ